MEEEVLAQVIRAEDKPVCSLTDDMVTPVTFTVFTVFTVFNLAC